MPSPGLGSADPGRCRAGQGRAAGPGVSGEAGAVRGGAAQAPGARPCPGVGAAPPPPLSLARPPLTARGSGAAGGCGPRWPLRAGHVEAKPAGVPRGWARPVPRSAGAGGSGGQWPAAVSHGRAPPAVLNPPPGGRRRTRGLRCRRGRERLLPPAPPPHGALGRGEAGAA